MFPAWVPLGSQRPRGVDAMGQRLIMLGGTWLLLVVMRAARRDRRRHRLVRAASRSSGRGRWCPAALVCAAIVAVEVLLATEALGPAYERLDITGGGTGGVDRGVRLSVG